MKTTLIKLISAHGIQAVKKNVRLTPGIDALAWPKGLEMAMYSLKTVFKNLGGSYTKPDFKLLDGMEWIQSINSRDPKGRLNGPWVSLSHHVGCLYAHMYQWQLAADNKNKHTYVLESDGLNPALLAVPVESLGTIVQHAPKDYDLLIINQPLFNGGKLFSRFSDKDGNEVEIYEWRKKGVAGLGAYLVSDR